VVAVVVAPVEREVAPLGVQEEVTRPAMEPQVQPIQVLVVEETLHLVMTPHVAVMAAPVS
jgi:hypothetical protein